MCAKRATGKKKLNEVEQKARELLEKYHNCSQCSLLAIQIVCEMKNDEMAKAASGLAGGVGTGSVCGGLTGSALALSMKYGRAVSDLSGTDEEAMEKSRQAAEPVARLAKWFEREFGSVNCRDLSRAYMGAELNRSIPWQEAWIKELGMNKRCQDIVALTARRAAAMLDNPALGITEEV